MNITTIREKYPQYSDLSDKQLVDAIHKKFYKDIPIKKFYETVGLTQPQSLPKHVNLKPKQNADITKNSTEIVVNPSKQSIEQPQSDFLFYLLVVVVGLLVWFFKTSSNKRSESNEHQKILETEFSRAKEFEKQTRLDAESIKVDAAKHKSLEIELNKTRYELEKITKIDSERVKADAAKQKILINELNQTRSELARQERLEVARIKVDATKQATLEAELNKSNSFEKQARLAAEQIKVDQSNPSIITDKVENNLHKTIPKVSFEVGEAIRINNGGFKDFNGIVEEVNYEEDKLKISVFIFGRSTSIEQSFEQVSKNYFKLGDLGPYGGIVFCINDIGNVGIEAKTTDELLKMNWNTSVSMSSKDNNDWRLPTKSELALLYEQKDTTVGGFTNTDYWSSTEYNNDDAWIQCFNTGYPYFGSKTFRKFNVRAVRSFDFSKNIKLTTHEYVKSQDIGVIEDIIVTLEKQPLISKDSTKQDVVFITKTTVVLIKDENTGKFEDMF